RLDLEARDYAAIRVEFDGVALGLVLRGPDRVFLRKRDFASCGVGVQRLSLVTEARGPHVLEVWAAPGGGPAGRFALSYTLGARAGVVEQARAVADSGPEAPARLEGLRNEYRQRGDREGEGLVLAELGRFLEYRDDARSLDVLEEALDIFEEIESLSGKLWVLEDLGDVFSIRDD